MTPSKVCPQCGALYGTESRFCSIDGAALVFEQPADDLVGTIVADRYHILERIGAGGMGEVYLAEHVRMRRKSALKVMREALTSDPVAVSRFHREAENASQISHPNVASVYDFGETSSGLVYIAMEYIPGEPLADILEREHSLHPVRVSHIIGQAADALSAAHALGILHRDLKPDNIMVMATRWGTDQVKLVDFGISRAMASATQQFTSTGMIVGTPDYMSPEQLTGDALDARSDQYALGLIAYFALTGSFPFPGGASKDALLVRLTSKPRPLTETRPDVLWPESLQAALDRALALDASQRYPEVLDFGRAFEGAVAQMPGTDEMEAYRDAVRLRFTTPVRGPSVTPARALPSIEMTPPTPVAAVDSAVSPGAVPAALAATTDEEPAPALGAAPARRPSLGRRLTAAGAAAALVALVVWRVALGTDSDGSTPVTNADSTSATLPATQSAAGTLVAAPGRSLDSTASLARGGVFAVYGPAQQGTAFLVDSSGIVLTAAEFVRGANEVRIQLEPERHVAGRVMAVDAKLGVAALRIPVQHCRRCTFLNIVSDSAPLSGGDSLVVPSAVGDGQSPVESRGAVERVDGSAVQTTLRVAPSAAGAPVLTDRGLVGLVRRVRGQTAIVDARSLAALRDQARNRRTAVLPNDTLLPAWPATLVPRSELTRAAERAEADLESYRAGGDGIAVLVMTPQVMAWRNARMKQKRDLAQVMALGDSQPRRRVDPIEFWRGWNTYVTERRAVVVVHAMPELAAYDRLNPRSVVDLQRGDVAALRLYRADTLVRPIDVARIPAVVNEDAYRREALPLYNAGIAVYHPRDFARRADRRFPPIVVELVDARTRTTVRIPVSEATLQAVERDLAPYQR